MGVGGKEGRPRELEADLSVVRLTTSYTALASARMSRYSHAQSILGSETHAKIEQLPILIVGAGGIGSELCELDISSLASPRPPSG